MIWTTRPRSEVGGLNAITLGAGHDVVLLHGVGLRAEAWAGQFDLPARITAPDMPGHGGSPFSGQMPIERYVDAAQSVLKELDRPICIVGHSMGAMLALELASREPEQVRGVAALNAVFERDPAAAAAVQARAAQLDGRHIPSPEPTLQRWFGQTQSDQRDACESWLMSVDPAAYQSAYSAFAHSQIPNRDRLKDLQCPALFLTGSDEPNSTPAMSRTMAELAPQGRVKIIDGAAHMMPMTHATEVNTLLAAFLSEIFA